MKALFNRTFTPLISVLAILSLFSCRSIPEPDYYPERQLTRSAKQIEKRIKAIGFEAKAWMALLSGSNEEAERALEEAVAAGEARSPARAILEFRLAAARDISEARQRAVTFLSQDLNERAKRAIAVMLGDEDFRDVIIDSKETATEYADYLTGYSQKPAENILKADSVIVVSEPETHGADAATVQVAFIACRDALSRSRGITVVDSASRKAALEELEFKLSGQTASQRDQAIGQLFSADYVASGSIISTDSGWLVAYSLSSSESGRIIASDFSVASNHREILAAAARFAGSISGE